MPISHSAWFKSLDLAAIGDAIDREQKRWDALTPKQRAAEQAVVDAQQERVRKHIAFLDYCVAKKIDPNLVLPVNPNK